MDISSDGQKTARDAAEAADEAEALLPDLQDEHKNAEMEAKRAEARALTKWFDLKHAEKKAKKLRAESNRLNPEPTFDQDVAPTEKKSNKETQTEP